MGAGNIIVKVTLDREYSIEYSPAVLAAIENAFDKGVVELATQFLGGEKASRKESVKRFRLGDVVRFVETVIPELKAKGTKPSVVELGEAWPVLLGGFFEAVEQVFGGPGREGDDPSEKKGSASGTSEPGSASSSESAATSSSDSPPAN